MRFSIEKKDVKKFFAKNIFSITNSDKHKIITILGLRIKTKLKNKPSEYPYPIHLIPSMTDLRSYIMAAVVNPRLEKYRGFFTGKDVLIIGGGTTLKYFKALPNTINIAINRAAFMDTINFDYIFVQDRFPNENELKNILEYKPETCKNL